MVQFDHEPVGVPREASDAAACHERCRPRRRCIRRIAQPIAGAARQEAGAQAPGRAGDIDVAGLDRERRSALRERMRQLAAQLIVQRHDDQVRTGNGRTPFGRCLADRPGSRRQIGLRLHRCRGQDDRQAANSK